MSNIIIYVVRLSLSKSNWSEIKYLTEKDLPYFRKKAEKGEAVILEIPPEILHSIDVASLLEEADVARYRSIQKIASDQRVAVVHGDSAENL